jgi:hypothetical protein
MNGDFRINQRGFTSSTSSVYGFDRWSSFSSGGTVTYSAQTFTVGTSVGDYQPEKYARLVTSGQSAASDYGLLTQHMEDVRTFAGGTVTVSFWAKAATSTLASPAKIAVELSQNFGSGGSPSSAVTTYAGQATLTTSWARYSLTVAVPSISGKTIGTTANTSSLSMNLWASAGSSLNARTGTLGIQSNTFDIWGVQVERGGYATSFEERPFPQELAMCQRYYEKSFTYGQAPATNVADNRLIMSSTATLGNSYGQGVRYTVRKRLSVSPVLYNPAAAANNWQWYNSAGGTTNGASINGASDVGFDVQLPADATRTIVVGHWTTDAEF